MKTTNFEISKKLKEIGFEAETDKCWAKIRNSKLDEFSIRTLDFSIPANCDEWYPSYDLETLIDALPAYIEYNNISYHAFFWNEGLGFYPDYDNNSYAIDLEKGIFEFCNSFTDESLADATGKLLIQLHETGINNLTKK